MRKLLITAPAVLLALLVLAGSAPADTSSGAPSPAEQKVAMYGMNDSTQHLVQLPYLNLMPASAVSPTGQTVFVNEQLRYQAFAGVGAAMTNSSAYEIHRLPFGLRQQVLFDLFSSAGANISSVRVSIGGSDFNVGGQLYTEDDLPPGQTDPELKRFNMKHDKLTILALKRALAYHPGLRVIGSVWGMPAWMKTNHRDDNWGGDGDIKPQYVKPGANDVMANYEAKWVLGMAKAGVPIYAITVLNEPGVWAHYLSMKLSARQEGQVVRDLKAAFKRYHLATKVYLTDASWGGDNPEWTYQAIAAAGHQADGIGWHCYNGSPTTMTTVHNRYPWLDQGVDECSLNLVAEPGAQLIIESLRNWATFVQFWNLALDRGGGPKTPNDINCRGCTGVITANLRRATDPLSPTLVSPDPTKVTFSRQLQDLAAFGHFISPGARRIFSTTPVDYDPNTINESAGIDNVVFRNPDGSKVMVAYNNADQPHAITVVDGGSAFSFTAGALATVVLVWH